MADVINVDLLNELMDLHVRLRQVNDDTKAFTDTYDTVANAFLSGKIDELSYRVNIRRMNARRCYHQESQRAQ